MINNSNDNNNDDNDNNNLEDLWRTNVSLYSL